MFCVCFVRLCAERVFISQPLSPQRSTHHHKFPSTLISCYATARMLQPNHFLARTTLCSHIWRHQIISARGRNKILSPHHLEKKRSAHGYSSPCVGWQFCLCGARCGEMYWKLMARETPKRRRNDDANWWHQYEPWAQIFVFWGFSSIRRLYLKMMPI
jgi:hypothetical protein